MPIGAQEDAGERWKKINDEVGDFSEFEPHWEYFVERWADFADLGRRFHAEFWRAKRSEGLLSMSDLEIFFTRGFTEKALSRRKLLDVLGLLAH